MALLEDEIDDLVVLDEYRIESARLRDKGREALARNALSHEPKLCVNPDAPLSEDALTIRALLAHNPDDYDSEVQVIVDKLLGQRIRDAFSTRTDAMPVLRAARAMHALVNSRGSTFKQSVMCFYYRLVRELYSAHAPEWITGGARAGEATATTAYATGEAVRAILGLSRALKRSAAYVLSLADLHGEWQALQRVPKILLPWAELEASRLARQFFTTLETEKGNIRFITDDIVRTHKESITYDMSFMKELLESMDGKVRGVIETSLEEFQQARKDIERYRRTEFRRGKAPQGRRRRADGRRRGDHPLQQAEDAIISRQRTETAHRIALGAVERAVATAEEAREAFNCAKEPDIAKRLTAVGKLFEKAAYDTERVIEPAIGYLSRVLDRELAAAASDDDHCDAPELAFAAASYGAAKGQWHDERLRRAVTVLSQVISERGRFRLGHPLRATPYGYKAHVIGSEVIRAFSQLLENVQSVAIEPRVVKSMLTYFEDSKVRGYEGVWQHDEPQYSEEPHRWSTAFAVLSLDRVNRMLDARINQRVLRHFSWRKPPRPGLDNLFYSDYGLATYLPGRQSVAIVLERMRAHISGLPSHYDTMDPVYSLILHGPAGTGKTTLVEALAKSSDVPLVEVTPSDIVIGGVDAVERRARAVFKALSLLTRVVIMFDEFDPVLLRRDPDAVTPASVFSFLTPGMLPKLKTLHDAAKRRSSAYVLITNLIGKLDPAAIREGRFDVHLGIYPPDVLSREGRLHRVLERMEPATETSVPPDPRASGPQAKLAMTGDVPKRDQRIYEVVVGTAGVSMNTLGKPGWYTAPDEGKEVRGEDQSALAYILKGSKTLACRPIDEVPRRGSLKEAKEEYREWTWVIKWDELARQAKTTTDALRRVPPTPPDEVEQESEGEPFDLGMAAAHCAFCQQLVDILHMHHETEPHRDPLRDAAYRANWRPRKRKAADKT